MKRSLLFSLALCAIITTSLAQNRLISDFGDTKDWKSATTWGNFSSWGVASSSNNALNPLKNDINPSDSVAQFQFNQSWGAYAIQAVMPVFNVYNNSILQFKAYVTTAGTLTCRVDNNANFSATIVGSFTVSAADINTWKVYEVSMAGRRDINYNNIQFGFSSLTGIVSIDDVTLLPVPNTVNTMSLYSQAFGGYTTFPLGDVSLYASVAGGGWGLGATVSGKAVIDYSNITSPYTAGTSLKVTADLAGVNAFTLSDIDVLGFTNYVIKFGFGHKQYWANPGIATNRPTMSWKIDDGAWTALTDATVAAGTVWPSVDGAMSQIVLNTNTTGTKLSIRFEPSAVDYFVDNLEVIGDKVATKISNPSAETPIRITKDQIEAGNSVIRLEVYSTNGLLVTSVKNNILNIAQLNKGIYVVKAVCPAGISVQKFVK